MGYVFWITGLSAAGKTTLAGLLSEEIRKKNPVIVLDGDQLRDALSATTDYSSKIRYELAFKYAKLAKLIASQGNIVIVSTVALISDVHIWNRQNQPNYFEIYIKVPISELRKRDPKGIYRRYDKGELKNVTGLDLNYDEPRNPDVLIDCSKENVDPKKSLNIIVDKFNLCQFKLKI
ncbi:adenylyl-sulfate kinase [Polynucleobacter sp. es-GGE-1]|uniref:adenylyl-sulfate kinase n=1 Tax=Polynucleobacter sp. es-GGE-1 TaxID=1819724 RepID=UPI001C0D011B|nr:adenylyl-sulfate kinase [Polynucleobacter sp. es-GGE-1]MBU3635544.1 adenylyl-sulfate kinase [Polynucleobacter sp. es-GGE-1]